MAAKRPGMILYHDKYEALSALDDHDFRRVIDALMHTSMTGEPVTLEGYVGVIYSLMASKLHDDIAKYERTVEARRSAANKRWKNANTLQQGEVQNHANDANAFFAMQTMQTKTLSQTVSQTETKAKTEISPQTPLKENETERGENAPTVDEVMEYARTAGCNRVDTTVARRFIAEQAAKGWIGTDGKPIRNWRVWFDGWYARNVNVTARPVPTSMQYDQRTYTPEELRALTDFMEGEDDG